MVDTWHGWESRNLDLMSSRRWAQLERGLSLEWFWANQVRKARQRFVEGRGENIQYFRILELQGEDIRQEEEQNEGQDGLGNILTHANPEWREQRSICARILDPTSQDRMKRRRAGVVHTDWDNLMLKWSGCQRLRAFSNDLKSFVKTEEGLCKRTLERDEDKKKRGFFLVRKRRFQNKAEEETKENKMKERERQRIWDPAWSNQVRILFFGDSNLSVTWMNGKWKINNQKFRMMVQKTQNMQDKTDIRPMGDHLDMLQHIYRERNQEADHLTHVAREKGVLHRRSRKSD